MIIMVDEISDYLVLYVNKKKSAMMRIITD
jgi:hypothetical protein